MDVGFHYKSNILSIILGNIWCLVCVVVCYVSLLVRARPVSRTLQCLSSWASQVVTQPCTTFHGPLTPPSSPPVSKNANQLPGLNFLSSMKDELGTLRFDVTQLHENIVRVLKFSPETVAFLFGDHRSGYPQMFFTGNMTSNQLLNKVWKDLTTYFLYVDIVATKEQKQVEALIRPQEESLEGSANTLLRDLEVTFCYIESAVTRGVINHIDLSQLTPSCDTLDMDDSDYIEKSLRVIRDFESYINAVISYIGSV